MMLGEHKQPLLTVCWITECEFNRRANHILRIVCLWWTLIHALLTGQLSHAHLIKTNKRALVERNCWIPNGPAQTSGRCLSDYPCGCVFCLTFCFRVSNQTWERTVPIFTWLESLQQCGQISEQWLFKTEQQKITPREKSDKSETLMCEWNTWNFENVLLETL